MSKIIGNELKNIPWEEKPEGYTLPVWRYSGNPIIGRHATKRSNSVFNSAVVPFGDGFAGVFRCDSRSVSMDLFVGFSKDGINWEIQDDPITFEGDPVVTVREYRYDPRVCYMDGKYYITWCNGYEDLPTIGMAWTEDFRVFHQMENAFLPYNRNGVLFPRKIGGNYAMLSRPSDNGHTAFGDIFYSESPDMVYWGKHRRVLEPRESWEKLKVGAGPVPIETGEGWLLIYHGVLRSCSGFVYSIGAALLDREQPWKVLGRTRSFLMAPRENYECVGDVPNVVFPCAALCDKDTGRLAIYYGAADTVTGLAFSRVDDIVDAIRADG